MVLFLIVIAFQTNKQIFNEIQRIVEELKEAIKELWVSGLPQQYCRTLARSMPIRMQAVLNADGNATKY